MTRHGGHAVVVGGSIAGMLAASVLSELFTRVTVLERDAEPRDASHRPGVPQGRHVHILLRAGQDALEALYPGFASDLVAAGSIAVRAGYDAINIIGQDLWPRRDLGIVNRAQSRELLESVIRRRLRSVTNVEHRWASRAQGVMSEAGMVTGVVYHDAGCRHQLQAELVVDAAGVQAHGVQWLRELGYEAPPEERIDVDVSRTTALFEIPSADRLAYRSIGLYSPVPARRSGLLLEIEGGRWCVTLGGRSGDHAPIDLAGFRAFAKSLASPLLYDAIHDLEPLEPIASYRYRGNVRRRFEKLDAFPDGLLVLGDALCNFNPTYAQGMSVAALEALALREALLEARKEERSFAGVWRGFFPRASKALDAPWAQAGNADLAYPETVGQRPPQFAAIQAYVRALGALAREDPAVHRIMVEVLQLIRSPEALSDPELVARIVSRMQVEAGSASREQ